MEMINIDDYKDSTLAKLEEQKKQTVPIESKVALTIKEAAEYSNIGINKLESLLRMPRCMSKMKLHCKEPLISV